MLVIQKTRNGMTGKLYYNMMGYHFTISYKRKIIARSYVHYKDKQKCIDEMLETLESIDNENYIKEIK